jgi:hypothetical protein
MLKTLGDDASELFTASQLFVLNSLEGWDGGSFDLGRASHKDTALTLLAESNRNAATTGPSVPNDLGGLTPLRMASVSSLQEWCGSVEIQPYLRRYLVITLQLFNIICNS